MKAKVRRTNRHLQAIHLLLPQLCLKHWHADPPLPLCMLEVLVGLQIRVEGANLPTWVSTCHCKGGSPEAFR